MSGTSSDDAAAGGGGGIPGSPVIGTKRHHVPSGSELAISGSNKKPSSDDHDDDRPWLNSRISLDEAYKMLTSSDFLSTMVRGSIRLRGLFSKATKLELQDRLKQLVASFEDLLTSVRALGTNVYGKDPEKVKLVHLAKHVLQEWESIEDAIPLPAPGSWLTLAPMDYPPAVPSAWLFEYHWRDDAHKEVLSIRKKYSYFLDEAYRNSYTSYLGKHGISGSVTLLHKKLLNFMASSREDFDFLTVEKCYKRVMSIKKFYTLMVLAPQCASEKVTDQTKLLPNWRDDIYDQVAAYRKMYSPVLDKLLLDEANEARRKSLEDALQFLASSRDVIAILEEDYCRKQLATIKQMEDGGDFLLANQSAAAAAATTQTALSWQPENWRDLEYVALQYKALRFSYEVNDVYLKHQAVWSEMPECTEDLKNLEYHLKAAFETYRMRRGRMSSMSSENEYHDLCSGSLKENVEACVGLIELLLGKHGGTKPSWYLDRLDLLIPKPCKWVLYP